jgi:hypothetical protein
MAITPGNKINTSTGEPVLVSAANGDTYGDAERALFRAFQELVMPNVINQTGNAGAPPASPTFGDAYIVPVGASGAWTLKTGQITSWAIDPQDGVVTSGQWEFYAPKAGWRVYDNGTGAFFTYNGSSWVLSSRLKATVTALASTTLSPASADSFRVNLNNVATVSVTISNGVYDGQEITILWVQGATTPSTVTPAANVHGFTTPTATVNAVSSQRFSWDSTASIWYASGVGATNM